MSLDKIIELLSTEIISGVTGPAINANAKELNDIKDLCAGNGVGVRTFEPAVKWEELKKNPEGLVPVVTQDYKTREVLMVAYMDEEAYLHTLKTGQKPQGAVDERRDQRTFSVRDGNDCRLR